MRRSICIIAAIVLALGVVEGVSYWWMHPGPAGLGETVLVYRPSRSAGVSPASQRSEVRAQEEGAAQTSSFYQLSTINDQQSSISPPQLSTSSLLTPLPEIYDKAAPMLRCSSGQVLHAALDDSSGIHLAFFEWDGTDTGSVLEAFRHMPEACMGSIGMKLVSHEEPRTYTVSGQVTGETKGQPTSVGETLSFDHTVFREGGGVTGPTSLIHAFRAVWVSGVPMADARQGLGGDEFDRLRTIRLKSAINRFRPGHARVIQGAVRGIPDPDLAWEAFEKTMLKDLTFK